MNKNTGVVVNGNWNQINILFIKYLSLSPFCDISTPVLLLGCIFPFSQYALSTMGGGTLPDK